MTHIKRFNLTVGPMELAEKSGWDVIISLYDMFPASIDTHAKLFWYPIDQVTFWGYPVFFATKRILDEFTKRRKRILVHCMMGAHRSRMICYAWLMSKGFKAAEIDNLLGGDYTTNFRHAIRQNHIPNDLPTFFTLMEQYPQACLAEIMIQLAKSQEAATSRGFGACPAGRAAASLNPPW